MQQIIEKLITGPQEAYGAPRDKTIHRKTINSSQPTYSGLETENINEWLIITERNLQIASVDDKEFVFVASTYLRYRALQEFNSIYSSQPNIDWTSFTAKMKDLFIKELEMASSLNKYISDYTYLINQIDNIDEVTKVQLFSEKN